MKSLLRHLLVIACALYLGGAHWMVLQMTAWTGMIVARAQQSSVVEAVGSTFDGKHPCQMCVAIDQGQKKEREQDQRAPVLKKIHELKIVAIEWFVLPERSAPVAMVWFEKAGSDFWRTDAPPTPPPLA